MDGNLDRFCMERKEGDIVQDVNGNPLTVGRVVVEKKGRHLLLCIVTNIDQAEVVVSPLIRVAARQWRCSKDRHACFPDQLRITHLLEGIEIIF